MMKRFFYIILLIIFAVFLFCSCSKESVNVTIIDERYQTDISLKKGLSVGEILSQAEISLSDKDEVSLDVNSIINEDAQIVIGRYAEVTLVDNGKSKKYTFTGKQVSDLLELNGLKEDNAVKVNYDKSTYLSEIKDSIVLKRKKTVDFILGGKKTKVETFSNTVEEFLEEQNITVGKKDILSVSPKKKIKNKMKITLQKVEVKTEVSTESIAFKTQKEYSSSLETGKSKVKQQGSNGEKEVTYKVIYIDGKEQSREIISSKTLKDPITKIVVYGTKKVNTNVTSGKTIVSKEDQPDCDGSGHGYYIITYSDGSVEYIDY